MFVTFRLRDCETGCAVKCENLEEMGIILRYVNNMPNSKYVRTNKSKRPIKDRLNISYEDFKDRFMN